ncbi:MAG: sulfite exporter TauE/SafE family protein [Clostridiales Family XIII bacterium]|jgi:sulfite exporter TauE/SafE/copper chaperone CopZ|nr:sulfite exporter TauE/SafE family protein [Clostridiales Family XIII bacterium]
MSAAKERKQLTTLVLRVGGMTCVNCQNRIERALSRTEGVAWARVSYADGTARVEYDPRETDVREIVVAIEGLGYQALPGKRKGKRGKNGEEAGDVYDGIGSNLAGGLDARRVVGILIVVVSVFFILRNFGFTTSFGNIPLAEEGMGYGLLFLIGLLTSVHCVAMCGGINISQCMPADSGGTSTRSTFLPSLKYNFARVCSYTAVGALVGGIGSAVSLSGDLKGLIQLIAGVFMVIMGLSMFGVLPGLGRLVPRMPRVFGEKIESAKSGGKGPIVVGLLNGLMPCGPLQAMQLFALSTGSPTQGALSMLCFSLGTVPLMFGLGALSSLLGGRFTSRAMVVGAALVVFLGLSMFTQGLTLSGIGVGLPGAGGAYAARDGSSAQGGATVADGGSVSDSGDYLSDGDGDGARASIPDGEPYTDDEGNSYSVEDGVQIVRSKLGRGYPHITVRAGAPVRWIIDAPEDMINGCNNVIYIPEYVIEHAFEPGENVIEFTPEKPGEFMYSCWMGMITSTITVMT